MKQELEAILQRCARLAERIAQFRAAAGAA
jgi:hypothetical protein